MEDMRKISSCSLHSSDHNYSQESILYALNRFIKSVGNMNNSVLVPNRLQDIDEDLDSKSIVSLCSDDGSTSSLGNSSSGSGTLHDQYRMIIEAKEDILWGTNLRQPEPSEASISLQFKYHLQQLQQLLNQFADVANHLTAKYESTSV
ncbi:mid1-interacting protein 1-like [Tetranychus urticae]|uniref:Mid1-interacting protein 1 n=1 Tax=Tetranychus urticae TaxID=32264 RepID=T1KG81_TETUR|nr:mid1-interacting protein 1-like [Tetranychus urticae]XP_015794999.1 mid1-interacting protein 1-like [Tetranychus urticae]